MKNFNLIYNIGKAKYVINYHNGEDTHNDGSPFYGIKPFSNKRKFNQEISRLKKQGYTQTN